MKKITSLLLALLLSFSLVGCGNNAEEVFEVVLDTAIDAVENYNGAHMPDDPSKLLEDMTVQPEAPKDANQELNELIDNLRSESDVPEEPDVPVVSGNPTDIVRPIPGEYYYDLENVVLYIEYYGGLPDNYITKKEARALGWEGGTPERYLEGSAIGGDRFGNREGLLPKGNYTECDLNTLGEEERGAERLVFSDTEYYYTEDHYESFTQVWVENGEVIYE